MYKTLTSIDEYGNLFYECSAGRSLRDSYQCCKEKCGQGRVCNALCRNTYIGSIPEDCAAQVGCSRPEYIKSECLDEHSSAFQNCCLKRCRESKWSGTPAISQLFKEVGEIPVDCVEYCSSAAEVLLNRVNRP